MEQGYKNKMMKPGDLEIKCIGCEMYFIHSTEEQKFFKDNGYQNTPKRCVECRRKKREEKK